MLVINENGKNLGTLKNGVSFAFYVELKNIGDKTITITNIRPGCGSCTTARVESVQITPFSSTSLICTFTPSGLGANYKKVFIDYSIDGVNHNITLRVSVLNK